MAGRGLGAGAGGEGGRPLQLASAAFAQLEPVLGQAPRRCSARGAGAARRPARALARPRVRFGPLGRRGSRRSLERRRWFRLQKSCLRFRLCFGVRHLVGRRSSSVGGAAPRRRGRASQAPAQAPEQVGGPRGRAAPAREPPVYVARRGLGKPAALLRPAARVMVRALASQRARGRRFRRAALSSLSPSVGRTSPRDPIGAFGNSSSSRAPPRERRLACRPRRRRRRRLSCGAATCAARLDVGRQLRFFLVAGAGAGCRRRRLAAGFAVRGNQLLASGTGLSSASPGRLFRVALARRRRFRRLRLGDTALRFCLGDTARTGGRRRRRCRCGCRRAAPSLALSPRASPGPPAPVPRHSRRASSLCRRRRRGLGGGFRAARPREPAAFLGRRRRFASVWLFRRRRLLGRLLLGHCLLGRRFLGGACCAAPRALPPRLRGGLPGRRRRMRLPGRRAPAARPPLNLAPAIDKIQFPLRRARGHRPPAAAAPPRRRRHREAEAAILVVLIGRGRWRLLVVTRRRRRRLEVCVRGRRLLVVMVVLFMNRRRLDARLLLERHLAHERGGCRRGRRQPALLASQERRPLVVAGRRQHDLRSRSDGASSPSSASRRPACPGPSFVVVVGGGIIITAEERLLLAPPL